MGPDGPGSAGGGAGGLADQGCCTVSDVPEPPHGEFDGRPTPTEFDRHPTPTEFDRRPTPTLGRGFGVGIALLALAGILIALLAGRGGDTPTPSVASGAASPSTTNANDHPSIGAADAPITMVEYSDFQCPYCRKFAEETQPTLLQEYVDKGLLRIEWRDYPAHGDPSMLAAVAARAAQQQGQFWAFHDLLYANQGAAVTRDAMVGYAKQLGLDTAAFTRALDNPFLAEAVRADYREGQERGVRGTPTFYFNGQVLVGAQPTATFQQAMQYLLEDQNA